MSFLSSVTNNYPTGISGRERMAVEIILRKICGRTEVRTRDLLNTSRTAHPTDLVGPACGLMVVVMIVLFEPRHEKTCFCTMRTTKAQISTFIVRSLDSIIPVVAMSLNVKPLASLYSWAGQFESYLVANPEDRFSRDEVHLIFLKSLHYF